MYTFEKLASNLSDTKDILDIIYNENPDHWPNGLSSDHFDGGLYVVKKQASSEPVGFVGWQERREDFNKVGYYSVGVLEKYRRNGFAKQAITQLLQKKASGVDIVKALIAKDNTPSISLAEKLDNVVMDIKQASREQAMNVLRDQLNEQLHPRTGEYHKVPWEDVNDDTKIIDLSAYNLPDVGMWQKIKRKFNNNKNAELDVIEAMMAAEEESRTEWPEPASYGDVTVGDFVSHINQNDGKKKKRKDPFATGNTLTKESRRKRKRRKKKVNMLSDAADSAETMQDYNTIDDFFKHKSKKKIIDFGDKEASSGLKRYLGK